jgi:hypothetical protein
MKKFDIPHPVKLVCGILYHEDRWVAPAVEDLSLKYGPIDFRSDPLNFNYTDYYSGEMGAPLNRLFVSFERLMQPELIANVKAFTNTIEEKYTAESGGKRVLNIDPGYLTATAYILTTSKNYAHRIYLGQGVFAQQELIFERKRTVTLDWTYPDYRSYEYQTIFRKLRQVYLAQIKASN